MTLKDVSSITSVYEENKTIGIGLIHFAKKLFFTVQGEIVYETRIPEYLKDKKLFASISIGSREDRIALNFGNSVFIFDLESKLSVTLVLLIL